MKKVTGRKRRQKLLRKKIHGTKEKPRLCISRSHKNLYAQLVDDAEGRTVFALSTGSKSTGSKPAYGGNVKAAEALGEEFAKNAKSKGFAKVVFDRAGYKYHGRLKAFADAARKNGLVF